MTFTTMCALRVYLKRGDRYGSGGLIARLFKQPVTTYLLRQALKHGVSHASVHHAHSGFTRGAHFVSVDVSDIPAATLPVCLELVAPKPILEQFVRDHEALLGDATLVMLDGVNFARATDDSLPFPTQQVEYRPIEGVTWGLDDAGREAGRSAE